MNSETVELNITGIVQGVGFRPFLYNLARTLELKGYVLNRGNAGVRLILQGDHEKIKLFLDKLRKEKPDIAYIEDIDIKYVESSNILYSSLEIKKSEQGRGISLTLPPDIAMCKNCLRDMRNQ
ncbi:MAG: acylphosphatase [Candidatus Lokiarchaeota archaeon]